MEELPVASGIQEEAGKSLGRDTIMLWLRFLHWAEPRIEDVFRSSSTLRACHCMLDVLQSPAQDTDSLMSMSSTVCTEQDFFLQDNW